MKELVNSLSNEKNRESVNLWGSEERKDHTCSLYPLTSLSVSAPTSSVDVFDALSTPAFGAKARDRFFALLVPRPMSSSMTRDEGAAAWRNGPSARGTRWRRETS